MRLLPHGLYGATQIESIADGQSEGVLSTLLSHGPRDITVHGQERLPVPTRLDSDPAYLGSADAHAHPHSCHHDGRWDSDSH